MRLGNWVLGVIAGLIVVALAACQPGVSASNDNMDSTLTPGGDMETEEPAVIDKTPDSMGTTTPGDSDDMAMLGKTVFDQNCSVCHGESGEGTSNGPGLAGNVTVMDSQVDISVQLLVHGKDGQHNFGDKLTDREIAAVLTYVRSAWGNVAGPVDESDVMDARSNPMGTLTP